jgi:PIN domain nuclease of toxin-antitoxin system
LLDTHALLWWLAGDRALSPTARTAMVDASDAVFVSAATAWAITTRFRLGRLPCVSAIAATWALSSTHRGSSRYRYRSLTASEPAHWQDRYGTRSNAC